MGYWPDLSIIDYPTFKSMLLATVDCWEPLVCGARSSDLIPHYAERGPFNEAWILYVPPHLAKTVRPPEVSVVEPAPDGGLILAATTDRFAVDNPAHLEAAKRIGRATAHLNIGRGFDRPLRLPYTPPELLDKPT